MSILPFTAVRCIWAVFAIFWLLAAFIQKRTLRRQSVGSRLSQLAIILLALLPFFVIDRRLEILYRHVTPDSRAIQYFGILLILIGLSFAVWARITLGGNWSGMVTVKEKHTLITHGPYAWVRHPIYAGILLALLGTALALGTLVTLLEVPLIALALWLKLSMEERLMFETFGEQYAAYRQQVKALIPHVI